MRYLANHWVFGGALLLASSVFALADNVRIDYDHRANFTQYRTYSWGSVHTCIPFYVTRIKQAVDKQLQDEGWQLVSKDASVTIFASDKLHNQKESQTMYEGMGGGWGGTWGWGGWGWGGNPGGFMDATTTTSKEKVGTLVIDVFDGDSKNLLWRGLSTEDLTTNASKNTKSLDGDIEKMFKNFPPKSSSK
jgi:Domain of unknown function (DUF4136)